MSQKIEASASGDALAELIGALQSLPGVGQKTAQRMAYQLLRNTQSGVAVRLARALDQAVASVRRCACCRAFTQQVVCQLCLQPDRQSDVLCVVESPSDLSVLEGTGGFHGLYFVLHGRLNPVDGVGLDELGISDLISRCQGEQGPQPWREAHAATGQDDADGASLNLPAVREVILATGFTAEGEATAQVLAQVLRSQGIYVTRLARGVPVGSDLVYVDLSTVAHALHERR